MGAMAIATRGIISKWGIRHVFEAVRIDIQVRNVDIDVEVQDDTIINITKE